MSRIGLYIGLSPNHAQSVYEIYSINTGVSHHNADKNFAVFETNKWS